MEGATQFSDMIKSQFLTLMKCNCKDQSLVCHHMIIEALKKYQLTKASKKTHLQILTLTYTVPILDIKIITKAVIRAQQLLDNLLKIISD